LKTQSQQLVNILELRRNADTTGIKRFSLATTNQFKNGTWENTKTGMAVADFLLFKNTNQPTRTTGIINNNVINIKPH
jgi:hypothetical protein